MNSDFVTVATFPDPGTAYLANQHLEAAGIRGYIADENMDVLFGNAIGWVKLQVAREDAVRATAVLDAKMLPDAPPSEDITARSEGIASAESFEDDPDDEVEEQERRKAAQLDEKITPEPDDEGLRSRLAERAFLAALVGLAICPLIQLYTLSLLLDVMFTPGTLTERARWRLMGTALLFVPYLLALMFWAIIVMNG